MLHTKVPLTHTNIPVPVAPQGPPTSIVLSSITPLQLSSSPLHTSGDGLTVWTHVRAFGPGPGVPAHCQVPLHTPVLLTPSPVQVVPIPGISSTTPLQSSSTPLQDSGDFATPPMQTGEPPTHVSDPVEQCVPPFEFWQSARFPVGQHS
jgi:hypothetical protein